MRHSSASTQLLALLSMGILMGTVQACTDDGLGPKPVVGPSTLVLRLPTNDGNLRRPAVIFPHGKHTTALGEDSCKSCHPLTSEGDYKLDYFPSDGTSDEAMNTVHDGCLTCHEDRAAKAESSGPVTCGGCHTDQHGVTVERADPRFDYSLHARHNKAENEECKSCHHVYDEKEGKLVYKKGEESACRDCHGTKDDGRNLSLRHASHDACVNCHAGRTAKGEKAGPTLCTGCHDAQQLASIKPLEQVPRLDRGQPDWTWIHSEEASAGLVAFDHKAHEDVKVTQSCSSCHHNTLRACKECHTTEGKAEGGFVTLEGAYHQPSATYSCVGCHDRRTQREDCAGCHHALPVQAQESSCKHCHVGPAGNVDPETLPEPSLPPAEIAELPATSDDFPDELTLEYMPGGDYGAVKFPHRRIVEHLDHGIRDSKLAVRFHGQLDTECAGCHHNTPLGARPPTCNSCHADDNAPKSDRPRLKAAFHRQCIECHQQMEIKAGCTDCHAETTKEAKQ